MIAVSNRSSQASMMKLIRFESHNVMFFCLLCKGPFAIWQCGAFTAIFVFSSAFQFTVYTSILSHGVEKTIQNNFDQTYEKDGKSSRCGVGGGHGSHMLMDLMVFCVYKTIFSLAVTQKRSRRLSNTCFAKQNTQKIKLKYMWSERHKTKASTGGRLGLQTCIWTIGTGAEIDEISVNLPG